jgi:hypothetical protein
MEPDSIQSFFALAIGFSLAGVLSTGYQAATRRPASFRLLNRGPRPSTLAAVPFLAFAAPYIMVRNALRGGRLESNRVRAMMAITIVAGFWSLMSGTAAMMVLAALGVVPM